MSKRARGTKLEQLKAAVRDPKVKLTHAAARAVLTFARSEFAPSTTRQLIPLLYRVRAEELRQLLPRRLAAWGFTQPSMHTTAMQLERELWWAFLTIEYSAALVKEFVILANEYEAAYISGDGEAGRLKLVEIEQRSGYSFWLLRATIHHAAAFEGLERQKELSRSIVRNSPRSFAAFLSWYISERNEEKVSIANFTRRMQDSLGAARGAVKQFLFRELFATKPAQKAEFAELLAFYSTNSAVDYYEALVFVIIARFDSKNIAGAERAPLEEMAARLYEVTRDQRLLAVLGQGTCFAASSTAVRNLYQIDHWLVSNLLAGRADVLDSGVPEHLRRLLTALISTITRDDTRDESLQEVSKFLVNGAHLVFSRAVENCHFRRSKPPAGDLEFAAGAISPAPALHSNGINSEILARYQRLFLAEPTRYEENSAQISCGTSLIERFSRAEWIRARANHIGERDPSELLVLVTRVILQQPTLLREIKVDSLRQAILSNLTGWKYDVRAAIFTHNLVQQGHDRIESKLQLLVKWLLERWKSDQLFASALTEQRSAVLYFLRHVCVQKNLTLLDNVKKSRDRRLARMAICRRLIDIGPQASGAYENEIKQLTVEGLKEEGLHSFDQSRVFVNLGGLKAVGKTNFTEPFERFKALAKIPDSGATLPVDLLRDLLPTNKDGHEAVTLRRGLTEVNELFMDMLNGLANSYLMDPTNGLDSYLSLRIRHGSMASSIRGPLEEAQLITSQGGSSDLSGYESNEYWLERLAADHRDSRAIDSILRKFSHSIDQIISGVVGKYVQVQGSSHPDGVFQIALSKDLIEHLSDSGRQSANAEDFFDLCFKTFSLALGPCLDQMRHIIEVEVKSKIDTLLTEVATSIGRLPSVEDAGALTHVVNETRVNMQQAVDRVIGWFYLREEVDSVKTYTIEELVEVCVAIARNTHVSFSPNVISQISETDKELKVMSHMMHPFSDAVFIMIDNVYKHSGLATPPDIHLQIRLVERSALQIRCVSAVAPDGPWRTKAEERLASIRESSSSASGAVNLEGGTGLLKLRRLAESVRLSQGEPVEFGFANEDTFSVAVHLPVQVRTRGDRT